MKYPIATLAMLGLLTAPAFASNSNVESALAGQGDVSIFYQALLNTGVARELKQDTDYTIFAPTNAAFVEIRPRDYPCFYSVQCRAGVAAVLRNHIVPRNESIHSLSLWGGNPVPTIGTHGLYVEETYKGQYEVEGRNVLSQGMGEKVSVYPIDGVIVTDQELAQFRHQRIAHAPGVVTKKTVTTYRTPVTSSVVSGGHPVPGGYPATSTVYYPANSTTYIDSDDSADDAAETTTVTHTTVTQ